MQKVLSQVDTDYHFCSKHNTPSDTETAKQKAVQAVALIAVLNGAYNAVKNRLTQAGINTAVGALLWINQEAFYHKDLTENLTKFSTENKSLKALLKEFEQVGIDLRSLSEEKREFLKKQMEQFHDFSETCLKTIREGNESIEAPTKKLQDATALSEKNLSQSQNTLALVFQQFSKSFGKVTSADDMAQLRLEVETLNKVAQSVVRECLAHRSDDCYSKGGNHAEF